MLSLNNLEIEAIELSIKVALNSVLFTLPLGLIAAWILARKRFLAMPFLMALFIYH